MKQLLLLAVVVTYLFACKKDKDEYSEVAGKWQWEKSVGGMSGADTLKPPSNATVFLTLRPNRTYTVTLNNQVVNQGTYDIQAPADLPVLYLDNFSSAVGGLLISSSGVSFENKGNRLFLTDYHTEPYTHHFSLEGNQ